MKDTGNSLPKPSYRAWLPSTARITLTVWSLALATQTGTAGRAAEGGKGDRHLLPERPEGCCAQKVPVPFSAEPLVLVENGQARSAILAAPTISVSERFAVEELQSFIRQISGQSARWTWLPSAMSSTYAESSHSAATASPGARCSTPVIALKTWVVVRPPAFEQGEPSLTRRHRCGSFASPLLLRRA